MAGAHPPAGALAGYGAASGTADAPPANGHTVHFPGASAAGSPVAPAGLVPQSAGAVPVAQVAQQGHYRFPEKKWTRATTLTRKAYTLGLLESIYQLQENWDSIHPEEFPFSEVDVDDHGRVYETLETFLGGKKAEGGLPRKHVTTITKDALTLGAALLESFVRVLLILPAGTEFRSNPLGEAASFLRAAIPCAPGAPDSGTKSHSADCQLVLQAIALYSVKQRVLQQNGQACRYGTIDADVLKVLTDTPAKARLEQWGQLIARVYIDFLRHIGEVAAGYLWEDKQRLTLPFVLGTLRTLPLVTHVPLAYATLTDLVSRTGGVPAP